MLTFKRFSAPREHETMKSGICLLGRVEFDKTFHRD